MGNQETQSFNTPRKVVGCGEETYRIGFWLVGQ
jgi:hypothetical protein